MKPLPSNGRRLASGLIIATAALATLALLGCETSGLSMRESGARSQGSFIAALTDAYQVDPNAPSARFVAPASIAVAQVGEMSPPQGMIEALRKDASLFRRVQSIPAMDPAFSRGAYYHGRYNESEDGARVAERGVTNLVRLAAASGADYLLLVGGTVDRSEGGTPLSAANLTIVGMFVVPSHKTTALMKASAALIDVKTGQLVALSSVDRQESHLFTVAERDGKTVEMLGKMRDKLTVKLAEQVIEDVKQANAAAASAGDATAAVSR